MDKPILTIPKLIETAKIFCEVESTFRDEALYGVTDGKAVGTLIELKFKELLADSYTVSIGNAAFGVDLPSDDILTDIKVTSIKQPQSSCPFKNIRQKVFGLGYNLLVFVYDKKDEPTTKSAVLDFVSCTFIEKEQGDYKVTRMLRELIEREAVEEEIAAYLYDIYPYADEMEVTQLASEIMHSTPNQGYWLLPPRLDYRVWNGQVASSGCIYFKPANGMDIHS